MEDDVCMKRYRKMSVFEIHKELFYTLQEIDRICRKYSISYYLCFGSLLGCIRDNGFIPWDDDIDIVMKKKDWNKFNKIIINEIDESKYFVINSYTRKEYPRCSFITRVGVNGTYRKMGYFKENSIYKSGIFIDIFTLEDVPRYKSLIYLQQKVLGIIDGIIMLKSYKKESIKKIYCISYILYCLIGKNLSMNKLNMMRNYIQEIFCNMKCDYYIVPMGSLGKYNFLKTMYKKEYFNKKILTEFSLYKKGELYDKNSFYIPLGYKRILETTYKNWQTKPKGKKPKGISYWLIEE